MRCLERGMEAAPAGEPHKLALGRLREPPWGYYGPCARCSLDGLAKAGPRKRGPEPINAAVERREARLSDRKERPHASSGRFAQTAQTCLRRAGRLRQPLTGFRKPRRFSALRSPRFCEGKTELARAPQAVARRRRMALCLRIQHIEMTSLFDRLATLCIPPQSPTER